MGKKISSYILITIALLALVLSFPGFFASAQTQTTTTSSSQTSSNTSSLTTTTSSSQTSSNTSSLTTTTSSSVDPSIALYPTSGSAGLTVDVSGSGFSAEDTSCSLSGGSIASQTCSISGGTLTAAFTVLNVSGGTYTVTATGTQAGDSASASFMVNAVPPSITLNPSSAQGGATVQVSGSAFLASDTACSLSGSPVTENTCSISSGTLTATFIVASIASGEYAITASGSPGGDSASASFTVNDADPSTGYSISFSPAYWPCTDVSVTFTGPLVESGYYGDTLQFQYFQYSPSYPSVLTPIFTDPGLTVTSDTVNYLINYNEYATVNFAYMPNIAVKVVDVTPKSNGYMPGQIFMQLTNIIPEGPQSCQIDPALPTPEFQADWIIIMVSMALSLIFLQTHNHKHRLVGTKKYPQTQLKTLKRIAKQDTETNGMKARSLISRASDT